MSGGAEGPASGELNLILDCDAGVDDLFALAVAALHPRARLLAVSVVGGNVPTREGVRYARMMLELVGRSEIPVFAGLEGDGALGAREGPGAASTAETATFAALRNIIVTADQPTVLVGTGSLTNVAVLLKGFPQLVDAVKVVFLGGVFYAAGNMSGLAERNVFSDPESAREVFESGAQITMLPIDVSGTFTLPTAVIDALARRKTLLHDYLWAVLQPYRSYYRAVFGSEVCPVHDPLAVLLPLAPQVFKLIRAEVSIELRGEVTRGATVFDLRPEAELNNEESRVQVVRAVDVPAAWAEIASALDLDVVIPTG